MVYCRKNNFTTPVFHKGTFYRDKTNSAVMKIQIIEYHKFYRKATEVVCTFPEEIFDLLLGFYKTINPQDKLKTRMWLINYCNTVFYHTKEEIKSMLYYTK